MNEVLKRIKEAQKNKSSTLYLSHLNISKLPQALEKLNNVKELDLSGNQLSNISALKKLTQLTSLDLSGNQLTEISALEKLTQLTSLDLSENQLRDISALKKLTCLRSLYLSHNQLTEIVALTKLKNIRTLDLCINRLTQLSGIENLTQLTSLYLRANQLSNIAALAQLRDLNTLDLSHNQLSDIIVLEKLTQLSSLDLSANQITTLLSIKKLLEKDIFLVMEYSKHPMQIVVGDNPLIKPPMSIAGEGNASVLQYFKDLETQGEGKLDEAKLIIVGEPEAGKSTLMQTLLDSNYVLDPDAVSTLGIVVKSWSFSHPTEKERLLTANIWDFGGQQIQYMTHQFFLTPDSVYVLVCANDRKTSVNFDYWFKIIHLLGEVEGRCSPVLVVKNHKSDAYNFDFDIHEYKKLYPQLHIEEREVNLKERGKDYEYLKETIENMLSKLPLVNHPRPTQWSKIQHTLKILSKERDHIRFQQYSDICIADQVEEEASQILLSRYLHTTGSLLHFVDDSVLYDFIILNPQWAVDAVYSVLVDTEIGKNNGTFKQEKLDSIWKHYHKEERAKLLNLMKKDNFEICFPLQNEENTYIAPQLLENFKPKYAWGEAHLKFRFQYTFMPYGIITRLIVRLSEYIVEGLMWQKGLVIQQDGVKAEIIQRENSEGLKVIDIGLIGLEQKQKYLLHTIRQEIKSIQNKWFKNINFEEMIPCNCEQCKRSTIPQYFKYSTLEHYQDHREKTIKCDKSLQDMPINYLLEGVFTKEEIKGTKEHPSTEIHNHIHLPKPQSSAVNIVKEERQNMAERPWYKEWWLKSVVATIVTIIISLFWLAPLWSILLGLAVGYFVFTLNPKRRYLKMAIIAFGGFILSASPPVAIDLGLISKEAWFSLKFGAPIHWALGIGLLLLCAYLFFLDSKER